MKVILLCADRYQSNGIPFYLAEINGTSLLELQIRQVVRNFPNVDLVFIVDNQEHAEIIDKISTRLCHNERSVVKVCKGTKGAAASALLVASTFHDDEELLIISTNEFVVADLKKIRSVFLEKGADSGVILFNSDTPKYSFAEIEGDKVIGVHQYKVVSNFATTGMFWFRCVQEFSSAAKMMIMKGESVADRYFVAPCLNEIVLRGGVVAFEMIDKSDYLPLKSDGDLVSTIIKLESILK